MTYTQYLTDVSAFTLYLHWVLKTTKRRGRDVLRFGVLTQHDGVHPEAPIPHTCRKLGGQI